ncbi:3-oxoacyl-[acyl-carrier-protein] reductase [Pseudorhodoferax soli]|uniref:3-oxoacyl-[acyl-carrier-protein] reductase n=1 Tax=Pseudorhodoferax soli TaxID=545864 RepID=A0A368XPQ6_9BURK|nr:glucose 1-dehydrogenase [Pseudorhodoferax soli]RCW68497.1 3-oxoacyl-[acyl-carrier-protein] reductase [Pseudorhodoferax soli]
MKLGLEGKVAIVTGSGRGIGAEAARALAEEGARVVVTDIDPETTAATVNQLRGDGHEVIGVVADVTKADDVARLTEQAVSAFGTLHILVNNAGFPKDNYLTKMPEADWDLVTGVILKGAYLCSKAAVPHMMAQRWGRIINISSRAHMGNPGQSSYSAAKAGLVGFTKAISYEEGKFNITVNAIAPGFVETELMRSLPAYDQIKEKWLKATPLPRLGVPRDIADAVLFLASERAGFITGELLHVTGGRYSN